MSLLPRNKHKLRFLQPDKSQIAHGTLLSYSDSEGRKVAGELVVQRLGKLEEFPAMAASHLPPYILLGTPSDKDSDMRNQKLFKYLQENKRKCGVVYLDSSGTVGLLTACEREDLRRMAQATGYRCYVIGTNGSSTSSSSSSSSGASLSGNKRGHEQLAAMEHYNENLNRDRTTRHLSQIFHMRNLNNCVKSTVIRLAVQSQPRRPLRVIDFGCGMGGDILKWAKSCATNGLARYVGVDIARGSLEQFATERLETFRGDSCKFVSHLICADVGTEGLSDPSTPLATHTWTPLSKAPIGTAPHPGRNIVGTWASTPSPLSAAPEDQFDIASCQFAAHYMFQTCAKADHFFDQVSQRLRTGGVFVCTTIDCRVIADMVCAEESGSRGAVTGGSRTTSKTPSRGDDRELLVNSAVGNTLLKITFSQAHWDTLLGIGAGSGSDVDDDQTGFGVQYNFALLDTPDAKAVNAPEWLIPQGQPLHALARRHGLKVRSVENFHEFVGANGSDRSEGGLGTLLEELGAFNYVGTLSGPEWEIARCYCVMVFEQETEKEDRGLDATVQAWEAEKKLSTNVSKTHPPKQAVMQKRDQPPAKQSRTASAPTAAFEPRSHDLPPTFEPGSPDAPPKFEPQSPDHPPSLSPHSPEGPPAFEPQSPDHPPTLEPHSPEGPPTFEPQSPDHPPNFDPHSPESSPPGPDFQPKSPDSSPPSDANAEEEETQQPKEDDEEDEDPFVKFLKRVRARAVVRAGGNRKWEKLDDDSRQELLDSCQQALEAEGDGPV